MYEGSYNEFWVSDLWFVYHLDGSGDMSEKEEDSVAEKPVVPLDEGDIALLKTYVSERCVGDCGRGS